MNSKVIILLMGMIFLTGTALAQTKPVIGQEEERKILSPLIERFDILKKEKGFPKILKACPDFQYEQYQIWSYLKTAIYLQDLGEKDAIRILKENAVDDENLHLIVVLCRMLFDPMEGEVCRRPRIGGSVFLGGTDYEDWPREPIELIDGIPFLITQGYILGGEPEPALWYVRYCEENCVWREEKYTMPSLEQAQASLNKLLGSDKWKTVLTETEKDFFQKQIGR